MKRTGFLFLALGPMLATAQITITNADFAAANQGYVISEVANPLSVDPGQGGVNQTWDFSVLPGETVELDTFVTTGSTPAFLQLVFNNGFLYPNHQADFAQPVNDIDSLFGLPLSDFYWFYQLESSNYEVVGFGANISGIDIPVAYDDIDRLFELPLNYGDQSTSQGSFEFSVPNLGFYGQTINRSVEVDGWGTIVTPYDTYDALRVVTQVQYTDTIALDTLGGGQTIPRPLETIYQWYAPNEGVPVLEITTQTVAAQEVPSSVRWKGSFSTMGIREQATALPSATVFPNPAQQSAQIWLPKLSAPVQLTVVSLTGAVVHSQQVTTELEKLPLDALAPGVYVVRVPGYQPERISVQ